MRPQGPSCGGGPRRAPGRAQAIESKYGRDVAAAEIANTAAAQCEARGEPVGPRTPPRAAWAPTAARAAAPSSRLGDRRVDPPLASRRTPARLADRSQALTPGSPAGKRELPGQRCVLLVTGSSRWHGSDWRTGPWLTAYRSQTDVIGLSDVRDRVVWPEFRRCLDKSQGPPAIFGVIGSRRGRDQQTRHRSTTGGVEAVDAKLCSDRGDPQPRLLLHRASSDVLLDHTWINRPDLRGWVVRCAASIGPSWKPPADSPAPDPTLTAELSAATRAALHRGSLPSGKTMVRPELERLLQLLEKSDRRLIVLIGEGGSGKSTLLADLSKRLQDRGTFPIAIRLDRLARDSATKKDLQRHLDLSRPFVDAARTVAASARTVVLLDQFDALCEVVSRSTRRLDLVLQTIEHLLQTPELRIVVACRPMEYEYDERLSQLDPEIVRLAPPPWNEIAVHIDDAGVPPETIGEELREELRRPLVLSTFLRLVKEGHPPSRLSTHYKMRRVLWNAHVGTGEGHEARKQALYELADWLTEHEQSTRPTDGMDAHRDALHALARAGFVVFQGSDHEFVEFRHQSYQEFALARSIVDTEKSLDCLIRGQRFRVRRRLWHVLADLREGNPSHYKNQLQTLWPGLRHHLQCLVLEFLGSLPDPRDFEIEHLRRALELPALSVHAWRAASRTPTWFTHLARRQLPDCMADPERDGRVFGVLLQGLVAHTDEVVVLVDRYWMTDPQRVVRAAQLFDRLAECTEAAHALLVKIAGSLGLRVEHHLIIHLVEAVGKLNPLTAIDMLTAAVDSDMKRWENVPLEHFRVQAKDRERSSWFTLSDERMESHAKDLQREALCKIFEENLDLSRFSDLVSREPRRFVFSVLDSLMRGEQALPAPSCDSGAYISTLNWPDRYWISDGSLIRLLATAVTSLAAENPDTFFALLDQHQGSESMAVHHLLLRGLAEVAELRPDLVLKYFRGDPRRMKIQTYARSSGSTIDFFKEVGPRLAGETQRLLAQVFLDWTPPKAAAWREDIREDLDRRERDIRLALLETLDPQWLAQDMRAAVAAYRLTSATDPSSGSDRDADWSGYDGSELTVPVAELCTWPDDRLLAHLLESPDSAPNSHWVAEEFAKLVAGDPVRGHRLIDDIPLKTHEALVIRTIDALIRAGIEATRVLELFWRHEKAGFSDQGWPRVAMALTRLAQRDGENGLPDDVCRRLRVQLSGCEIGNIRHSSEKRERAGESIVYPHYQSTVFSSMTLEILYCLFAGYVRRGPRGYDPWMDVLDEHLERDDDVQVWQSLARRVLVWTTAAATERAEPFLNRLRSRYPALTSSREGFVLLDRVQDKLDRGTTRRWIEEIRSDGDPWRDQAFGELLVLRVWRCPDDPWPRERIDSLPASEGAVHRGVVFMIVRLLRDGHEFDEAMVWLERLAQFEDEHISSALHGAVWKFRDQRPCVSGGRLLGILARTPFHLRYSPSFNLLHVLEQYLVDYPVLVTDVCEKLLEITRGHTGDPRELLRLILAIEAKDDQAEAGLRMFERACDLELYGTHELLLPR